MRTHQGAHPRMGATDVCPLVPLSNITMEEVVECARRLAKRVGEELGISVYCYEHAAFEEKRRNLASCREGEYEGLREKLIKPEWKPDFGPTELNERAGATAIGARNFLVAFNVNLNTTSTRRAFAVAFDVREMGRTVEKEGKKVQIPGNSPLFFTFFDCIDNIHFFFHFLVPSFSYSNFLKGTLKKVKAIGWFIKEYGFAQVSMNLTDIGITPIHIAFDEVERCARERGIRVIGSELVGLVPLQTMIDAGKYYLRKQKRSVGISEHEIIQIAVKSLGLDQVGKPFNPDEKIIEYLLNKSISKPLQAMTLSQFANETASESAAPGGGSVAAYMGTLGVSLAAMVANLSSHKRGFDDRWEEFSIWAEKAQQIKEHLISAVDEDTAAFNSIMDAFGLPKSTPQDAATRKLKIQEATKEAVEVPLNVMRLSLSAMPIIRAMAEIGNPNSVTDAGVGATAARSAVIGAYLNVKVNLGSLEDKEYVNGILHEAEELKEKSIQMETEILQIVISKLN
jgi:glutamate formiminotransferase / formiminotetrahydrofolate cyclodeaminase